MSGHSATGGRRPTLLSRRIAFSDPRRSHITLSSDGSQVAWLSNNDGALGVEVAPATDPASARRLVPQGGRPVSAALFWAETGRHVVVFRDQLGDENYQAFSIDTETGSEVALTPSPGVRALLNRTSRTFPFEILFGMNERDRNRFDLVRVNVSTGLSTMVFENHGFSRLYADSTLTARIGERVHDDGSIEVLRRQPDGRWALLLEIPAQDSLTTRIDALSEDGRHLFLLDSRGRDRTALVDIDIEANVTCLLASDDAADISTVVYDLDYGWPLAASAVGLRRHWHKVDETFAPDLDRLVADSADRDLMIAGVSSGRQQVLTYHEASDSPGEYSLFDRATRRSTRLFRDRDDLDGIILRPMRPIEIRARDGLLLPCYMTLPEDGARFVPMVVAVHGGPHDRDVWGFSAAHQWLASRGYAVLSVNFRGSTGFGKSFTNAAEREWGGRMQDDLNDGVGWAVDQGIADPTRVALFGASYGGYAALMAAAREPELYACFIDINGPSNLLTFIESIPPYWHSWFATIVRRLADPATDQGRDWLTKRSPLFLTDRMIRPVLIAQGLQDVRVNYSESRAMSAALRQRNVPVTLVTFPDEGHFFVRQQNRVALMAVIEAFLARHLAGLFEPLGNDLAGSSVQVEVGGEWLEALRGGAGTAG